MSIGKIRIALETALASLTPALATAYENVSFTPANGVPYQKPYLLTATPANPTVGPGYHQERGIFQITLMYPILAGSAAAAARAEMIQGLFARGAVFTSGGIRVQIIQTTEICPGAQDGDRWAVPVKVRWSAEIFT